MKGGVRMMQEPLEAMMRPVFVDVDLDAIRANVRALARHVGVPVMAVVKADAYGHGAIPVAAAALEAGAARLAVHSVVEGIRLRQAGISCPILVLGWARPDTVEAALRYGLTLTVFDREGWRVVAETAARCRVPGTVHLKIDSGMGRLGFGAWDERALAAFAREAGGPWLEIEGAYTHFASADLDDTYTLAQLERFDQAVAALRAGGLPLPLLHAANSAAALRFPQAVYDCVRIGVAVYGLEPFPGAAGVVPLRPALAWRTQVAQVKTIPAGIGISYGTTFVPDEPMRVAVLPVGYADGFDRGLSNRGCVLIRGRRVPVRGLVCMNQIIVGPVPPETQPGDEVVLIGRQGAEEISAAEMAAWLDTNLYEVVTRIDARVPRRYHETP